MKRTVVWLTEQHIKALTEISETSLAPVSALIHQAVKEFLEKRSKKKQAPSTS
jgi:hypothetical protein